MTQRGARRLLGVRPLSSHGKASDLRGPVAALVLTATLGFTLACLTPVAQAAPSTPPTRYLAAVAYDAARSQVVLFGGWNGDTIGGTWTWDGTTWTHRTPAHSPP